MLTVKYIGPNGREKVVPCPNVVWVPDNGDAESFGKAGLYYGVDCELDLSGDYPLDAMGCFPVSRVGGVGFRRPVAYVMNEHGATIASYDL